MVWSVLNSNVGTASGHSVTGTVGVTLTIPAGVTLPVGTLVVVGVACAWANSAVTDSKGNTYTRFGTDPHELAFSFLTTALVTGDTITAKSTNTGSGSGAIGVAAFTGGGGIDAHATQIASSGTTPSNSVTPAGSGDLFVATVGVQGPNSQSYTEDTTNTTGGSWIGLTRVGTNAGSTVSNQTLNWAYKISSAAGTQTYAPTLGTSEAWNEDMYCWLPGTATQPERVVMLV